MKTQLKYSEFLKEVAKHIVTQDEYYTMLEEETKSPITGYFYSKWICNVISTREDAHSDKLRKTIKRKITNKDKNAVRSFTGLFINTFDPELNKQYRINWLLTLAAIHESKGN